MFVNRDKRDLTAGEFLGTYRAIDYIISKAVSSLEIDFDILKDYQSVSDDIKDSGIMGLVRDRGYSDRILNGFDPTDEQKLSDDLLVSDFYSRLENIFERIEKNPYAIHKSEHGF